MPDPVENDPRRRAQNPLEDFAQKFLNFWETVRL